MRIKKTYNGVVPNGKLLNSRSTSTTDSYSCEYLNGLNTYSFAEVIIGKYIDENGIKYDLYRKMINIGNLPNAGIVSVSLGLNKNNCILIKADGYAIGEEAFMPLSFAGQSNNGVSLNISVNGDTYDYQATIQTVSDRSNLIGRIILEYIKTTD